MRVRTTGGRVATQMFLLGTVFLGVLLLWQLPQQAAAQVAPTRQGALLEDERNTVELVQRYGPSVVAVTVRGVAFGGDEAPFEVPFAEPFERPLELPFDLDRLPLDPEALEQLPEGVRILLFGLQVGKTEQGDEQPQGESAEEQEAQERGNLLDELERELQRRFGPEFRLRDLPEELRERLERRFGPGGDLELPFDLPLPGARERRGSGFFLGEVAGGEEGEGVRAIVTSYELVRGALQRDSVELREGAEITVTFVGGVPHEARVVGVNPEAGLALLEPLDADAVPAGLEPLELADSDGVLLGQKAVALANPSGQQPLVTAGPVAAVGAGVLGAEASVGPQRPLLAVAAVPLPGLSGGPLLDSSGQVIGVVVESVPGRGRRLPAGVVPTGVVAVPSNLLRESLEALAGGGVSDLSSRRPRIGVTVRDLADYPEAVRRSLRLPAAGAMVVEVLPDSPAARAGLRGATFSVTVDGRELPAGGDVITALDGEPVRGGAALQRLVFAHRPGDRVVLEVVRDGERLELEVTLELVDEGVRE